MGEHAGAVKAKLLTASKTRSKVVDVDGEPVNVREVGALEFAEYGALLKVDRLKATAQLIAACIVDEDGNPVLTVEEATQVARSARVSMPLVTAIMELSGFGEDEGDEKEPDAS